MALEEPSYGQKKVSDELRRRGIFISPAGVRCVWLRHNLETFKKRLKALEEHVAKAAGLAFGDGNFHREIVAQQMGM